MDRNIGMHCCSKHLHLSLQVWSATSVQFEYVICWQRCAQSRSEFVEGRLLHPTVCSPDLDEADRRKQIIWRGREKKKDNGMLQWWEALDPRGGFCFIEGGGYGEWAKNYHCPWLSARRNPNCTLSSFLRTCMFNAKSSWIFRCLNQACIYAVKKLIS